MTYFLEREKKFNQNFKEINDLDQATKTTLLSSFETQ